MTTPHIHKDIQWLRGLVERARECCDMQIQGEITEAMLGALANPYLHSQLALALFIRASMEFDEAALESLADLLAAEAPEAPEQSQPTPGSTDPALFHTFVTRAILPAMDIDHGSEVPA